VKRVCASLLGVTSSLLRRIFSFFPSSSNLGAHGTRSADERLHTRPRLRKTQRNPQTAHSRSLFVSHTNLIFGFCNNPSIADIAWKLSRRHKRVMAPSIELRAVQLPPPVQDRDALPVYSEQDTNDIGAMRQANTTNTRLENNHGTPLAASPAGHVDTGFVVVMPSIAAARTPATTHAQSTTPDDTVGNAPSHSNGSGWRHFGRNVRSIVTYPYNRLRRISSETVGNIFYIPMMVILVTLFVVGVYLDTRN
jgi:hypothetical protein